MALTNNRYPKWETPQINDWEDSESQYNRPIGFFHGGGGFHHGGGGFHHGGGGFHHGGGGFHHGGGGFHHGGGWPFRPCLPQPCPPA